MVANFNGNGVCSGDGGCNDDTYSPLQLSPKTLQSSIIHHDNQTQTESSSVTLNNGAVFGVHVHSTCSSSSAETVINENELLITTKEEDDDDDLGAVDFGDDVAAVMVVVKPMEGLHDTGPPPFLKKTFEMVEDPETDPIVSWSVDRNSFIVWDCYEFSKKLLPKYFKHSNFSSFIRQLNTYGFRKIDSDRWEFANEGFQGGKKHLLKNIKRKSRYNKQQTKNRVTTCLDVSNSEPKLETELENLKNDQNTLRMEISKLRQQQEDSEHQLGSMENKLRNAECKQQQMFNFLSKVAGNPNFVHQLMLKKKLNGNKKRRLIAVKKQFAVMQSELDEDLQDPIDSMHDIFPAPMDNNQLCSYLQDQKISSDYPLVPENEYLGMSEEGLMVYNSNTNDEEFDVNDSKIYFEIDDVASKPGSWGGFLSETMEQIGCIGTLP